jgi:hypothetical protein
LLARTSPASVSTGFTRDGAPVVAVVVVAVVDGTVDVLVVVVGVLVVVVGVRVVVEGVLVVVEGVLVLVVVWASAGEATSAAAMPVASNVARICDWIIRISIRVADAMETRIAAGWLRRTGGRLRRTP